MAGKLTPKRGLFIAYVLQHGNATLAAKEAGFAARSAHVMGARLLKDPGIAAILASRRGKMVEKAELTAELVLGKIVAVLRADPRNLYDQVGNRIPVHLLDDVTRGAIAAIEEEVSDGPGRVRTMTQKLKFADGLRAAELGGKYLKLFGGDGAFSAAFETGAGGLPPDSTIKIVLVRPE